MVSDINLASPPAPLRRPKSPMTSKMPKLQDKPIADTRANEELNRSDNRQNSNDNRQKSNDSRQNCNDSRQNSNDSRQTSNGLSRFNRSAGGNRENSRDGAENRVNRHFNNRGDREMRRPHVSREDTNGADENEEWGAAKPQPPQVAAPPKAMIPTQVLAAQVHSRADPPAPATPEQVKEAKTAILNRGDCTPSRKIVPKNYALEVLNIGDSAVLSVEKKTDKECICVCMHESIQEQYQTLVNEYTADCEKDTEVISPQPGETFSLLNPEDSGWYRARMLTRTTAALLDGCKIVEVAQPAKRLPAKYASIPEFSCVLAADVNESDTLKCTLLSKTPNGVFKVAIENIETEKSLGEGLVTRWMPKVEYAQPVAAAPATFEIPEIQRQPLINNSKVILLDGASLDKCFVVPSEKLRDYDNVLQRGAAVENPLKVPPQRGQVVIAKYKDGLCYRALVKRTNVKLNKYLIEFIEFGNEEKTTLECLHACPPELDLVNAPCVTTQVKLCDVTAVTSQAALYVDALKDSIEILLLTLPDGQNSAPSGSEATLIVAKSNENVNKKLMQLCSPEWKNISDVVEDVRPIMFSELQYTQLPLTGCELEVIYVDLLQEGSICARLKGDKQLEYISDVLTKEMTEYCNSEVGKEPYLPAPEELCLAQWPVDETWYRAVLLEQVGGAGRDSARVLFVDYGNLELVPAAGLRKMLPAFVRGRPAAVAHLDIRDFPSDPTPEQLTKALLYMNVNDEGRGTLRVDRLVKQSEDGAYTAYAQGLIDAMKA